MVRFLFSIVDRRGCDAFCPFFFPLNGAALDGPNDVKCEQTFKDEAGRVEQGI